MSRPEGQWRGWPRPDGWQDVFDGVDDLVVCAVVARLARQDAVELLTPDTDDGSRTAIDEVKRLRERLDGFVDAAAAGKVTPAAPARIEAKLLPEIEAAEARVRPVDVPAAALELAAAADPAQRWLELDLAERRHVVDHLMTVELTPAGRGNRRVFDPGSVHIEWRRP